MKAEILHLSGWPGQSAVVHGFTTRASYGMGHTLDQLMVRSELAGFHPAALKQVHGNRVVVVEHGSAVRPEGDALVTSARNVLLTIATADCLPVLLYGHEPVEAVAAIHCGWRGLAAEVIRATLESMSSRFRIRAQDLSACLGPAIEVTCYEVRDDVKVPFANRSILSVREKLFLDLALEATLQLQDLGVPPEAIRRLNHCTRCDADRFFSYRRDGAGTGRMINFIGMR